MDKKIATVNPNGIKRDNLPQIKQEDVGSFANFLKKAKVPYKVGTVSNLEKIKPLQDKLNLEKVKEMTGDIEQIADQLLIVSREGSLMDGHHRLAALKMKKVPAKVLRIGLPLKAAYSVMSKFNKTENKSIHEFLLKNILEDWMFEPHIAGHMLPAYDPATDMTQSDDSEDDDDALPKYKHSVDNSLKKTNNMIQRYYKKNRKQSRNQIPPTAPEDRYIYPSRA